MNYNNPAFYQNPNFQNPNYPFNQGFPQFATSVDVFFFDFTRSNLGRRVFDSLQTNPHQGEIPTLNLLNNETVGIRYLNLLNHWTETNKNARMSHKNYPHVGMVLSPGHPLNPVNPRNPLMTSPTGKPKMFLNFVESDYTIETILNCYEMLAPFFKTETDKMVFLANSRESSMNVEKRDYFEKEYYVIDFCLGPVFSGNFLSAVTRIRVDVCKAPSKFWKQIK